MDKLWLDLEYQKEADAKLRSKYGIYSYRGYHIKNEMVFRMIAKIAHSYAVAELGYRRFTPLLTEYIRFQKGDIQSLIGGTEQDERATNRPYRLAIDKKMIDGANYVIVAVQVLANRLASTFLVVTGRLDTQ
jgi:hypothetical protein